VNADLDIEAAVLSPSRYFSSPEEVLQRRGLSHADRRRILESWVRDAKLLADAEAEGMAGPGRPRLQEAVQALSRLGAAEPRVNHTTR
jgi:hypothetical protein